MRESNGAERFDLWRRAYDALCSADNNRIAADRMSPAPENLPGYKTDESLRLSQNN